MREKKDDLMRVSPEFKQMVSSLKKETDRNAYFGKKVSDRMITKGLYNFLERERLKPIVIRRFNKKGGDLF